jgi:hypothetical protein
MKLTLHEQETTINYNNGEKIASIYTCDKGLILKLDRLMKKNKDIRIDTKDSLSKTYTLPKTMIKIHIPKVLSEEQKEILRERAKKNGFGRKTKQV